MLAYEEFRYNVYERDYLKNNLNKSHIEFLPHEFFSISANNSFIINAIDGRIMNATQAKNIDIDKVRYSVKLIEHNHNTCLFQIVVIDNTPYINPWFVQLPEVLMKERIRVGFIKPSDRNILVKLNSLLRNTTLTPTFNSVCVLGRYTPGKTSKQIEAERKGNPTIPIDEYIEMILSSSVKIYID